MIRYSDHSVFDAGTQAIVNTVNTMGVMGAGLALEFRLRYPAMYEDYVARCARDEVALGQPYLFRDENGSAIVNFPTKAHWKYPSKLSWVERGLAGFVRDVAAWELASVAFPLLGCSKGGLRWEEVGPLMEAALASLPFDVVICFDRAPAPEGLEARMIATINQASASTLASTAGLRRDLAEKVAAALPLGRMRDLARVPGLGERSYEQLFAFAMRAAQPKSPGRDVQLMLDLGT